MHLVIYFCGTTDSGVHFANNNNYLNTKGVKFAMVKGCADSDVCDDIAFPNLKKFARRFASSLFEVSNEGCLQLKTTEPSEWDKIGFPWEYSSITDDDKKIDSIILCGYSRGAVTCFEVAEELQKIAPGVPVSIVADQSVPGNSYQGPGTNAASIADCSNLQNLEHVSTILGAYTGLIVKEVGPEENKKKFARGYSLWHRLLYSQIVPKLPGKTTHEIIVIPRQNHEKNIDNTPECSEHMHWQIAKLLQRKNLVDQETVETQENNVRNTYQFNAQSGPALFPRAKHLQSIFGFKKEDVYRHLDPLHPAAHLRHGMTWDHTKETLLGWWERHDKNASWVSSDLTKTLVGSLRALDSNNKDHLISLLGQADKWLMKKQFSHSSRYDQVESLRNNIYHRLLTEFKMTKKELAALNRKHMHEELFFREYWRIQSKQASFFQTPQTDTLDQAFFQHALDCHEGGFTLEKDQKLLDALNAWLNAKKDTKSKRYDLVLSLKERLANIIQKCYLGQDEQVVREDRNVVQVEGQEPQSGMALSS